MATATEILSVFDQSTSISNSDQVLIQQASGVGNKAVKVTAEIIRAYLMQYNEVAVNSDGYLTIGGSSTGVKVEGVTPQFKQGADGLYVSTDKGTTWTLLASYEDFAKQAVVNQTNTTTAIAPNVLNVWGAVDSLTLTLSSTDSTNMEEYMLEFSVASEDFTLTTTPACKWSEEPEWEQGYTYHVSILNGLAVAASFS